MRLPNHLPAALPLALALALLPPSASAAPRDAVLLSQVQSLTLRAGRQTSHRRAPAAPQLKCISAAPVCAKHAVDVMRCENRGAGYGPEDVQWSCSAQLPPELKLGSTDVACEGYAAPDDPYVLKGSCGVEYRLVLTREGEERWPGLGGGGAGGDGSTTDWFAYVFWAVFLSVLGYIVYNAFVGPRQGGGNGDRRPRAGNNNNFWGGGGGGGGGGGWDDPPPPYPGTDSNNNQNPPKRSGGASRQQQQQGWRPDVWSAAAGAAAGYGFGRMGNNRNSGAGRNYGSTWGGGGSGGAGPSRSNSSGSSSNSGASSSRYESTGFGSTSRR